MVPAQSLAVSLGAGEGTSLSPSLATTDIFAFSSEIKGWVPLQRHSGSTKRTGGFAAPDIWGSLSPAFTHHPALSLRETSRELPGGPAQQLLGAQKWWVSSTLQQPRPLGLRWGKQAKVSLT